LSKPRISWSFFIECQPDRPWLLASSVRSFTVLDLSEAVVIKVVDLRLRLDEARGNGSSSGSFCFGHP
jgi:hypothetical protein